MTTNGSGTVFFDSFSGILVSSQFIFMLRSQIKVSHLVVTMTVAIFFALNLPYASVMASDAPRMAPRGISRKEIATFNEGIRLLRENHPQEAIGIFRDIVSNHPSYADAQNMYGAALLRDGQNQEAVAAFEKAERLDPDDALVLFNLGNAYMSVGRLVNAATKFDKYLKLHPRGEHATKVQSCLDMILMEKERNKGVASSQGQDDYLEEAMASGAMRWPAGRMPVPVYIESGSAVRGYQGKYTEMLKQAFAVWAEASEGKLSFRFTNNADEALINCSWTDDESTLSNKAEGGETLPMFGLNGTLMSAKIKILTYREPAITEQVIRYISLHEVGHACGLYGHSSQVGDIMLAASVGTADMKLSERDRNTIFRLYRAPDSFIAEHPVKLDSLRDIESGKTRLRVATSHRAPKHTSTEVASAPEPPPAPEPRIPGANEDNAIGQNTDRESSDLEEQALEARRASADYARGADYFANVSKEGVFRWPKSMLPIKVYIEPGISVRNYRDTYRQAIIASFNDWVKAVQYRLSWRLVSKKEDANIICRWVGSREELLLNKHKEQGVTHCDSYIPTKTGEGWLEKVGITICTTNIASGRALRDVDVYNVCRHEVGHALGLSGHSNRRVDAMYPVMDKKLTGISQSDTNTINHLYAAYTTTTWD